MFCRIVGLLIAAAALSACSPCNVRPADPVPVPVEVIKLVVEPIPAEWVNAHPIEVGPLNECPRVASARRAELVECNEDKAKLRARGKTE